MVGLQRDLISAQREVASGTVAEPGLTLGASNGRRMSMERDIERVNTIIDTNGLATSRLDVSLSAIEAISSANDVLLSTLTASLSDAGPSAITTQTGQVAVSAITSLVNTMFNGEAVFGGINSATPPLASFETGGPKAALDASFLGHFGFAKTDPAASGISGAAMTAYLDAVVEPLFSGAGWGATFSSASSEPINARIRFGETLQASVSANEPGVQNALFAAVIASEYFAGDFNSEAKSAAAKKALGLLGSSSAQLADLQGRVGVFANRIEQTTSRLRVQADELTLAADRMIAVDPYEAATRLNSLITQIETSYTLTGRIQQLSLMRYL